MATSWTGSVDLLAGQVALVSTKVETPTGGSFMLRISVPELSFGMDFAYTGSKFLFEGAGGENPITVEAVDEYPVQNTYSFRLRFVAAATGSLTAEWLITAGDATLEQCFISPE